MPKKLPQLPAASTASDAVSTDLTIVAPGTLSNDEWTEARKWSTLADRLAQSTVAAQVMCGFALLELREKYGGIQGKRTDLKSTSPNDLEKLPWPELVKQRLGKSDETARNWMNMATAIKPRLKKLGSPERFAQLMETPQSEWTEAEADYLSQAVHKITDGYTQTEFLRELGLAKLPQGYAAKGGDLTPRDDTGKRIEKRSSKEEIAIGIWEPIMRDLLVQGLQTMSWANLPDAQIHDLKGILIDFNKLVPVK